LGDSDEVLGRVNVSGAASTVHNILFWLEITDRKFGRMGVGY